MKVSHLLGGTALALVMCSGLALAQMQQKGEEKTSPGAGGASRAQSEKGAQQSEPKGKSSAQSESGQKGSERGTKGAERSQPKEQGAKGSAQTEQRTKDSNRTEPSEHGTKGAQTQPQQNRKGTAQTEPKEQGTKGSAQTEPRQQGTKGSAQTEPREQGRTKGSAQTEPGEQGTKGSARTQPTNQTAKGGSKEGSAGRVQLSEQQRTNVHDTILKERNVNRLDRVNFSINVGTRVPRSVRLVALPAAVFSLVPQYRSYRYFVANDEICIVDPNTYEIVDVVSTGTQTARGQEPRGMAQLTLTQEEKRIILDNVDMHGDSTLALGSLSEGSSVPRGARLESFPEAVVQQVPKVRGYKYFTAEDRVAIADPQGTKVQLVIDAKR